MSNVVRDPKGEEILLENEAQTVELQTLNTNGAKEAKQDTQITELQTLNAVDFATEAKQDDIITAIGNIGGGGAPTATESSVSQSATSSVLSAADANRKELYITNRSQGNTSLFISFGATATTNSPIELKKGDTMIETIYTGVVSGIWASAGSGSAPIIEVTNP